LLRGFEMDCATLEAVFDDAHGIREVRLRDRASTEMRRDFAPGILPFALAP
jgi:hypothetical protein